MNDEWNQRYLSSNIPWDSGIPSHHLESFLAEGIVQPGRVLELGCGTGTNAILLAQHGFDVTAVDVSSAALDQAREKAHRANVKVRFVEADVTNLPDIGAPFPFAFDRGTYHVVRKVNLSGFQSMLARMVERSGFYLVLTGNSNTQAPSCETPPGVRAGELVTEIEVNAFDLVALKRTVFHGVKIDGNEFTPLAWSALFQRRTSDR